MNIEQLLNEAPWRLRAYLGAPDIDPDRVGCRRDPLLNPLAEWLFEETKLFLSADAEWVIAVDGQIVATPPPLALFSDLIDTAMLATDSWQADDMRISRQEALATLSYAEQQAARYLLPRQAQSVAHCDYQTSDGHRCDYPAMTPPLHCFIESWQEGGRVPLRSGCREFAGRLCETHLTSLSLVVPPAAWYATEKRETAVEGLREAVLV